MCFNNYIEKPVVECLKLCRLIEQSFEMTCPDLFEFYKQDRLHGHDHVWNVMENSLMITSRIKDFYKIEKLNIDYEHLIAACLLHDTAGLKIDFVERALHHLNSKKYIEIILAHFNNTNSFQLDIDRVYSIAKTHGLRPELPPKTLDEEIIALADGLDENMNRLYLGNKKIRPFFDEKLSFEHRLKVVMRRKLENEGISREDPSNDTIMFMIDSLIRNSIDFNPWKLVLKDPLQKNLLIKDICWQIISKDYFDANYSLLIYYIKRENGGFLVNYVKDCLFKFSQYKDFSFLKRLNW